MGGLHTGWLFFCHRASQMTLRYSSPTGLICNFVPATSCKEWTPFVCQCFICFCSRSTLFYLQIGPQQAMETPSSNAFELCVLLFSLWFDVRSCSLLHLILSHPLSVGESFMLVPHRFSKELFSIVLLAFCKSMHWKLSFACTETSTSYYFSFSSCSRWGVDHFYQLLCTFLCWLWLRDIAWPLHGISFISVFIFNDLNSFFFNIATFLTLLSS